VGFDGELLACLPFAAAHDNGRKEARHLFVELKKYVTRNVARNSLFN
jgi:hypothetical protein